MGPVHQNCACSGHKNGRGQGGICGFFGARKSWCYVQPTCPHAVSSKYSGLSWSFCTVPKKTSLYEQAAGPGGIASGPGGTLKSTAAAGLTSKPVYKNKLANP